MKLAILVPCRAAVSGSVFPSLAGAVAEAAVHWTREHGPGRYFVASTARSHVCMAREDLLRAALQGGADRLLWLDDDAVPSQGSMIRLLSHRKDIVVPWFLSHASESVCRHLKTVEDETGKRFEKSEAIARPTDHTKLIRIGMTGFHCVSMSAQVAAGVLDESGGHPFQFRAAGDGWMGEDAMFYQLAYARGYELWLDPGIHVGHSGEVVV